LQDLVEPAELYARANNRARVSTANELVRLPNQRILVVDDGEANRRLIELVLSRAGAQVVTAQNGQEAIDSIHSHMPSLVLMDMQMPVLDGYAATRQLRQAKITVPIIALTGNAMLGDREKCIHAGCNDFLTKPVNLDELLLKVASYLGEAADTSAVPALQQPSPPLTHNNHRVEAAPANAIFPSLPMDDPDFLAITSDFVSRLEARLDGIETAIASEDFETVHSEAHWLKGAAGTVGLVAFTLPAKSLEQAAKDRQIASATETLRSLRQLRERVHIPALKPSERSVLRSAQTATVKSSNQDSFSQVQVHEQAFANGATKAQDRHPMFCSLPIEDPEFCTIVRDFVKRLDTRLAQMRMELRAHCWDDLVESAHWLKGAGGTVGYAELTNPASDLVVSAKNNDAPRSRELLGSLLAMRKRMVVPT
jgi:CheY-like chemotaxis protein/HPt (histidine-containing phosphotransfer) domain-containing protein